MLAQDGGEALKIVHYFWDDAKCAFVTISNTPLDAAKTNRAAMVFRSEPSPEDLSKLAHSFFNTSIVSSCSAYMQHCIKACCQAYAALIARNETGQKRHLRDFHHFLKYFNRRCRCAPVLLTCYRLQLMPGAAQGMCAATCNFHVLYP